MSELSEPLRQVMRKWPSGVAIATSSYHSKIHGMTVNSFNSISLDPPLVSVTLANNTRTANLVREAGVFGISILHDNQEAISDRFAGKVLEKDNRFDDLNVFTLLTGVPFLESGIGFVDCKVVHQYEMTSSTLFIGEVLAAKYLDGFQPLIYFNRGYHKLNDDR